MKQKITMKFIAEKASVSVATVSSVINNSNFVSKKLTDRVNKTIKKYKYQKDFLATSLRKRMTKLIGIVIVDLTNTINAILCSEVEKLFRKHGYNTTISSSELDFKVEQECIYELINRNIDGIIIIPLREGRENYKNLFDSGKPVVILNREFKNTNSDFIMFDSYNAMVDTIDHLANLGHKRIAYINRAIFWGRKIIIMDEPTAALGVKESAKVLDMILNIRQNLDGIIVITHNIEHIIRIADRVIVLRTGRRAGSIDFKDYKEKSTELHNDIVRLITGAELIAS